MSFQYKKYYYRLSGLKYMKKLEKLEYYKNRLVRGAIIFLILMFSLSFIRNIGRVRKINEKIKEKEKRISQLKTENEEIKKRIEEASSQMHKEKEYRNSLGLIKEGEIVVVLPDKDVLISLAPDLPVVEEEELKPNWRLWLEAFKITI